MVRVILKCICHNAWNKEDAKFVGWKLFDDTPNNCGDEVSMLSYKYWERGYIAIFEEQSTTVADIE